MESSVKRGFGAVFSMLSIRALGVTPLGLPRPFDDFLTLPPRANSLKCAHTCNGILSNIALHVQDFYVYLQSMLKKCEETIHTT